MVGKKDPGVDRTIAVCDSSEWRASIFNSQGCITEHRVVNISVFHIKHCILKDGVDEKCEPKSDTYDLVAHIY